MHMSSTENYSETVVPSQSALLSFKSDNVLSYRDKEHFSLLASPYSKNSKAEVVRELPTVSGKPVRVLPAAGIFGKNASGKTTLLRMMRDMRFVVLSSFKNDDGVFRRPFLFDEEKLEQPSSFEVDLLISGVYWNYGFSIDSQSVLKEHAYYYPKGRRALVFERIGENLTIGKSLQSSSNILLKLLRDNILLLSVAGAFNEENLKPLFYWFQHNMQLEDDSNKKLRSYYTSHIISDPAKKEDILSLLRAADLDIVDIRQIDNAENYIYDPYEETYRLKHSSTLGSIELKPLDESLGTKVWVGFVGKIYDALINGTALLIDDLDTSLHPSLVRHIVDIFQDKRKNPNCAQLIFNSHDHTLFDDMELPGLGRDQIWLTEKSLEGVTSVYPLTDFQTSQNEELRRRYLFGRYGGVPDLDHADFDLELNSTS